MIPILVLNMFFFLSIVVYVMVSVVSRVAYVFYKKICGLN